MTAAVALAHVRKTYGAQVIVDDLSLEIGAGELVVFVGPSGCGKSTLLRIIAGLLAADRGTVSIGGRDVTSASPGERDIAMVFQSYALYPHLTVYENIAFPLRLRRVERATLDARVRAVAEATGIGALLARRPAELSGGQRQRVAMSRALVREPKVFLFDEPLSNLDAGLRAQLRAELATLHRRLGTTMIYVTHDQHEAMTLATRLVVLSQGRIEQMGAPLEVYEKPSSRFVGEFFGNPAMRFIRAHRDGAVLRGEGVDLTLTTVPTSAEVVLGLRPEWLARASAEHAPLRGVVDWIERTGSDTFVHARVGETALVARMTDAQGLEPGAAIGLAPTRYRLFDANSGRALG